MPPPPDLTHILVFIPNWLGDVVMATPALRALRRRYPDATITAAGKASCCAVLAGFPCVDRLHTLPERPPFTATFSLARRLADPVPDLAVLMPNSFRTAWIAWLTGATHRIGYKRGGRSILLSQSMERYREHGKRVPRYTALEYLALVEALGAEDDGMGLELSAKAEERAAVRACLEPGRPVVAIAPGAAFGPSKRWLPERFAAVADQLHDDCNAQIVLMTGPGEEATRDAVIAATKAPLIFCNKDSSTIERLKATLAEVDILIGNDSGPRHIAIAFKKPVICIMGSTSPRYTESPWETGDVVRVEVDCGPCQKPHCNTDHRCMTGVTVARVVAAAKKYLSSDEAC